MEMEDPRNTIPRISLTNGYEHGCHANNTEPPEFGICFDVDGVLARGHHALPAAAAALHALTDPQGLPTCPIAFVTNALCRSQDKARQIAGWFGIDVDAGQVIHSATPLAMFHHLHEKRCLLVGQGPLREIAKDLGFRDVCLMEEVRHAYPLLDMVDHANRKTTGINGFEKRELPQIEAVVLLGEPTHWESSLQLLVDLLRTDGRPDTDPPTPPYPHLPVVACNMDLQFMERAPMPRFGHGAFLLCLESLYKACTGKKLQYTALVGKPSEVTFRYAEHVLHQQALKLRVGKPLKRIYMIGDSVESDITGANLYNRWLANNRTAGHAEGGTELPDSRKIPPDVVLLPQTVESCLGLLVCTGCYRPEHTSNSRVRGHRDFPHEPHLHHPQRTHRDVAEAVEYIMSVERQTMDTEL